MPEPTYSTEFVDAAMSHAPSRRAVLTGAGALGVAGALGALIGAVGSGSADAATSSSSCSLTPAVTEGPYWVDTQLLRSDLRASAGATTAQAGVPLTLTVTLFGNSACTTPLSGAHVDIWHANAQGLYSDEAKGGGQTQDTTGQTWLRGYQVSDDSGAVTFTTIYPGWYSGRAIHIHVRVRTYNGTTVVTDFVSQFFFAESTSDSVMATSAYARPTARDTTNSTDSVYSQEVAGGGAVLLALSGSASTRFTGSVSMVLAAAATTTTSSSAAPTTTAPTTAASTTAAPSTTPVATVTPTSTTSTTASSAPNVVNASLSRITARTIHGSRVLRLEVRNSERVRIDVAVYNSRTRKWVADRAQVVTTSGKHTLTFAIPTAIRAGTGHVRVRLTDSQKAYKQTSTTLTIPR